MRDIVLYPDNRLKTICDPVDSFNAELRDFVQDLLETCANGPGTVGIAAPQVGILQRICIVDATRARKPVPNHGQLILVNPEITAWEGFAMGREGCLSVPDYTGNVVRAEKIQLKAYEFSPFSHLTCHLTYIFSTDEAIPGCSITTASSSGTSKTSL